MILFNIPESGKQEADERRNDDTELVKKILSSIGIHTHIANVTRLGMKEENPNRPVRVKVATDCDQSKILKAASKLSDIPEYRNVHINRDMTPLERVQRKKLLEEKKKKTEESTQRGENTVWVIRGNRVVKGRVKVGQQTK